MIVLKVISINNKKEYDKKFNNYIKFIYDY